MKELWKDFKNSERKTEFVCLMGILLCIAIGIIIGLYTLIEAYVFSWNIEGNMVLLNGIFHIWIVLTIIMWVVQMGRVPWQ